jgi:hypothetical protein
MSPLQSDQAPPPQHRSVVLRANEREEEGLCEGPPSDLTYQRINDDTLTSKTWTIGSDEESVED